MRSGGSLTEKVGSAGACLGEGTVFSEVADSLETAVCEGILLPKYCYRVFLKLGRAVESSAASRSQNGTRACGRILAETFCTESCENSCEIDAKLMRISWSGSGHRQHIGGIQHMHSRSEA